MLSFQSLNEFEPDCHFGDQLRYYINEIDSTDTYTNVVANEPMDVGKYVIKGLKREQVVFKEIVAGVQEQYYVCGSPNSEYREIVRVDIFGSQYFTSEYTYSGRPLVVAKEYLFGYDKGDDRDVYSMRFILGLYSALAYGYRYTKLYRISTTGIRMVFLQELMKHPKDIIAHMLSCSTVREFHLYIKTLDPELVDRICFMIMQCSLTNEERPYAHHFPSCAGNVDKNTQTLNKAFWHNCASMMNKWSNQRIIEEYEKTKIIDIFNAGFGFQLGSHDSSAANEFLSRLEMMLLEVNLFSIQIIKFFSEVLPFYFPIYGSNRKMVVPRSRGVDRNFEQSAVDVAFDFSYCLELDGVMFNLGLFPMLFSEQLCPFGVREPCHLFSFDQINKAFKYAPPCVGASYDLTANSVVIESLKTFCDEKWKTTSPSSGEPGMESLSFRESVALVLLAPFVYVDDYVILSEFLDLACNVVICADRCLTLHSNHPGMATTFPQQLVQIVEMFVDPLVQFFDDYEIISDRYPSRALDYPCPYVYLDIFAEIWENWYADKSQCAQDYKFTGDFPNVVVLVTDWMLMWVQRLISFASLSISWESLFHDRLRHVINRKKVD